PRAPRATRRPGLHRTAPSTSSCERATAPASETETGWRSTASIPATEPTFLTCRHEHSERHEDIDGPPADRAWGQADSRLPGRRAGRRHDPPAPGLGGSLLPHLLPPDE